MSILARFSFKHLFILTVTTFIACYIAMFAALLTYGFVADAIINAVDHGQSTVAVDDN